MKRDVYVLTEINRYSEEELYVHAYAYTNLARVKEDMLAEFNTRLEDTFDSDESCIVDASDEWMELRRGDCYCTWGIERQSVEFDD